MRTKNKKWIGPVPIAAVAALALAALLSAGLWLMPNGVQAQSAPTLSLSGTVIKAATADVRTDIVCRCQRSVRPYARD